MSRFREIVAESNEERCLVAPETLPHNVHYHRQDFIQRVNDYIQAANRMGVTIIRLPEMLLRIETTLTDCVIIITACS